jgi:hypothetical protein
MHSLQLKAALEERLAFYSRLMEKLSKAIEQEDAERIVYYQGLEQETLKSLTNPRAMHLRTFPGYWPLPRSYSWAAF